MQGQELAAPFALGRATESETQPRACQDLPDEQAIVAEEHARRRHAEATGGLITLVLVDVAAVLDRAGPETAVRKAAAHVGGLRMQQKVLLQTQREPILVQQSPARRLRLFRGLGSFRLLLGLFVELHVLALDLMRRGLAFLALFRLFGLRFFYWFRRFGCGGLAALDAAAHFLESGSNLGRGQVGLELHRRICLHRARQCFLTRLRFVEPTQVDHTEKSR
ncbi:MAG: hypothetical protein QM756_10695 [Polyangiaceae bacterium]